MDSEPAGNDPFDWTLPEGYGVDEDGDDGEEANDGPTDHDHSGHSETDEVEHDHSGHSEAEDAPNDDAEGEQWGEHQDQTRFHDNGQEHDRRRLGHHGSAHRDSGDNVESEYFGYVLSADCSSCDGTVFDAVKNAHSVLNDDAYGDRTAYYMTGPLFDCAAESEVLADCAMDSASYECPVCTAEGSDGDLGYSRTAFPELFPADSLSMGTCGVAAMASYSDRVPEHHSDCVDATDAIKPSLGTDGRFCVCVRPQQHYDQAIRWRAPPSLFDDVVAEWTQKQVHSLSLSLSHSLSQCISHCILH